ncbi:MAG: hypothetical protein H6656_02570 [Ardenticatenaceae bacterium]|nr:hypothetical protein [Ardenticatenaceae bacterium]
MRPNSPFWSVFRRQPVDASVAFLTLEDLPETAVAWNALDVLIFNDADTSQLTSEQRTALDVWLRTVVSSL